MYAKSFCVMAGAVRSLIGNRVALALVLGAYAGLLSAAYLFVITREATISQTVITLVALLVAPALFFFLQAVSISYSDVKLAPGFIRRTIVDCLKLLVVSIPLVTLAGLTLYFLNRTQTHLLASTTLRYLIIALIIPLLTIQLWITVGHSGLRAALKNLRGVLVQAFAPQSVAVYTLGFLVFAVAPYFLLQTTVSIASGWLELTVLIFRLALSAILILGGWVTTVGAISILNRGGLRIKEKL